MIKAAKSMFHKLLEEARDDLERVTPQPHESLCSETPSERSCSRPETSKIKLRSRFELPGEKSAWQTSSDDTPKTRWSGESLEQIVEDRRKQLEMTVSRYKPGEWKYEFGMSSFTTTILNQLFTEAERKDKTRNFRTYIGPGSDGSIADKLSLDLEFNPWDTGISFRLEWHSMSKTVFTQYDPFETWYTCQSDVWLDDVKAFHPRPLRCVIVIHPYRVENTSLLTESAFLSCAKNTCRRFTFLSRPAERQVCIVEQETEE